MPKTETMNAPPYHEGKDGHNYIYVRAAKTDETGAVPLAQLADDEIVISPGWIYRRSL